MPTKKYYGIGLPKRSNTDHDVTPQTNLITRWFYIPVVNKHTCTSYQFVGIITSIHIIHLPGVAEVTVWVKQTLLLSISLPPFLPPIFVTQCQTKWRP